MKKFFVVCVDEAATTAHRDAFTNYLRESNAGFWHHLPRTWLIADLTNSLTATILRDRAHVDMPGAFIVALEVTVTDWGVYAPKASHDWLEEYL
jgi:hypothetical protein